MFIGKEQGDFASDVQWEFSAFHKHTGSFLLGTKTGSKKETLAYPPAIFTFANCPVGLLALLLKSHYLLFILCYLRGSDMPVHMN